MSTYQNYEQSSDQAVTQLYTFRLYLFGTELVYSWLVLLQDVLQANFIDSRIVENVACYNDVINVNMNCLGCFC